MTSPVYFIDDRANMPSESLPFKAVKVFRDAGLGELFNPGDTVGIKIHMGERGTTMNLRPQHILAIVDEIKRLGGMPVIVETTTLSLGFASSRATAVDALTTARDHGFTEETMGCPIVISDGEYGFDDIEVNVPNGIFLNHTYMAKFLAELDALISVAHFKGHPSGIFGGAIKNVGIGCGSKRGKLVTHLFNHPDYGYHNWKVNFKTIEKLNGTGILETLESHCPFGALKFDSNGIFNYEPESCRQCATCRMPVLLMNILEPPQEMNEIFVACIADSCSAYANTIGKVGYINYAIDITPLCDCVPFTDRPMTPNLGVFASRNPVALDMACLEMALNSVAMPGSSADDGMPDSADRFTQHAGTTGASQWIQINAGIHNGLGTNKYQLIQSKPFQDDMEFWMPPYTPEFPWGLLHAEALRSANWAPTTMPYSRKEPRISVKNLSVSPIEQ